MAFSEPYKSNERWLQLYTASLSAQGVRLEKDHPQSSTDFAALHYFLAQSISGKPSTEHVVACSVAEYFKTLHAAKDEVAGRMLLTSPTPPFEVSAEDRSVIVRFTGLTLGNGSGA